MFTIYMRNILVHGGMSPEVACYLNSIKERYKDALLVDMTMGARAGDNRLPHDVLFAYKRR